MSGTSSLSTEMSYVNSTVEKKQSVLTPYDDAILLQNL